MIAEFFNLAGSGASPERALFYLANKYQQQRVLIWCQDEAQAARLDLALWTEEPASFMPHGLAGAEDAATEPVLLSTRLANINRAQVLLLAFNPPADWLPPTGFARVVELIPASPGPALEASRSRYRQLGQQRVKLEHTTEMA